MDTVQKDLVVKYVLSGCLYAKDENKYFLPTKLSRTATIFLNNNLRPDTRVSIRYHIPTKRVTQVNGTDLDDLVDPPREHVWSLTREEEGILVKVEFYASMDEVQSFIAGRTLNKNAAVLLEQLEQ